MPGRRLAGIVAAALIAAAVLAACTGDGEPQPTPDAPTTASPTGSRDPVCLREAGSLILRATSAQGVLTTLNATERTSADLQTAIAAEQGLLDEARAMVVHHPLLAERVTLIAGMQDIVEGLQAEAAAPTREQARIAQHQTSKGSGEVNVARANAMVQRAACSS